MWILCTPLRLATTCSTSKPWTVRATRLHRAGRSSCFCGHAKPQQPLNQLMSTNPASLLVREQAIWQEAEILRDANIALTENLSLERVLETLLDYLSKLVPYDSANVMLRNGQSEFVVSALRRYEGFQDVEMTRAIVLDLNENPLLRRMCETKQSLVVPDPRREAGWQWVPGADHVRNWMGVPLVSSGRVIGLYSLDKTEPNFFQPEHVRVAEALAARAASAIQNAQLF